jgi:hypothetical protein
MLFNDLLYDNASERNSEKLRERGLQLVDSWVAIPHLIRCGSFQ